MIIEVLNPLQIPAALKLAANIPDVPVDKLKKMMIDGLTCKTAKIILSKKDNEANAFLFATVDVFDGEDVVFIQTCYIDPNAGSVGREMLNMIDTWAKERGIKDVVMITPRNPKAYERKYRFELTSYVMKRRIS